MDGTIWYAHCPVQVNLKLKKLGSRPLQGLIYSILYHFTVKVPSCQRPLKKMLQPIEDADRRTFSFIHCFLLKVNCGGYFLNTHPCALKSKSVISLLRVFLRLMIQRLLHWQDSHPFKRRLAGCQVLTVFMSAGRITLNDFGCVFGNT